MLDYMILKRSNGGFGESLAYDAPFTRMCYFIHSALRIMSRGRGLEGPVCRGLLYVCGTSVNICSKSRSISPRRVEDWIHPIPLMAVLVLKITLLGPYRTHSPILGADS